MKKLYTLIFGALSVIGLAQAPANYYSGTEGLAKEELKTKLSAIISQGHIDNGYDGLWRGYYTTDVDNYYEKDGTLLDIYSEIPNGIDSYTYKIGAKQCGTYSGEGQCYNREHIVPQSLFNKESPMRNDIHFIVPTDGYVNGKRSNYPFDVVSTATWTSKNGSKLGKNASGSIVFEPIDEFKGDVARMIFYFATRYESQLSGFKTGGILGGSAYPGIDAIQLDVLLKWHNADPVSQKEIDRNNYAYKFQGNRNPYIDNPDWVNVIWSETSSADTPADPTPAPTEPDTPETGEQCGITEDFEGLINKGSYVGDPVIWTKNGITWTATSSRTDLEIEGKALTIRNGSLASSTIAGGIGSLTLITKLPFKDKAGDLIVKVNDVEVGKIPYVAGGELTTTTIENINIEGNVVIAIVNETSNRVAIDNLSWTCYNSENTEPVEEPIEEPKDTEAPTTPTNVAITETTTESISLEWTASTDNVGVEAYDIYVDEELKATVSEPDAVLEGLTPDTEYSITIVAKDEAGNQSTASEAVVGRTKPVEVEQPIEENPTEELEYCFVEDFENMGSISNYGNVTWENNGITWTAVNVRTDQTINSSKALTFRHATNSSLTSSTIKGGVGSLTITTQLKFSGSEGELAIIINDVEVGKVPYSAEVQTTTIKDINISGDAVIYIANPEGKNRIAIDNISWTCYSNGEEEAPIEETPIEENPIEETPIVIEEPIVETPRYTLPNVVEKGKMAIYPNPVRSYEPFVIYGLEKGKVYTAEVYNSAGRLITKFENIKGEDAMITINQHLASDVYILRVNGKGIKFIVK